MARAAVRGPIRTHRVKRRCVSVVRSIYEGGRGQELRALISGRDQTADGPGGVEDVFISYLGQTDAVGTHVALDGQLVKDGLSQSPLLGGLLMLRAAPSVQEQGTAHRDTCLPEVGADLLSELAGGCSWASTHGIFTLPFHRPRSAPWPQEAMISADWTAVPEINEIRRWRTEFGVCRPRSWCRSRAVGPSVVFTSDRRTAVSEAARPDLGGATERTADYGATIGRADRGRCGGGGSGTEASPGTRVRAWPRRGCTRSVGTVTPTRRPLLSRR